MRRDGLGAQVRDPDPRLSDIEGYEIQVREVEDQMVVRFSPRPSTVVDGETEYRIRTDGSIEFSLPWDP